MTLRSRVLLGACPHCLIKDFFFSFFHTSTFQLLDKPWSQEVSSLLPPGSCLQFLSHIQSHCSSMFHRVLLSRALALPASQIVHKKKSPRIYTSVHSGGFELTKLTYTRLEDSLIRHRGDRYRSATPVGTTASSVACTSQQGDVGQSVRGNYENTWKCGELKLYFSPSAGGKKNIYI